MADVSPRAAEVLALTKEGKNPTEIGTQLGITSQAVHGHLRRLRDKGLLPPDPRARGKAGTDNGRSEFSAAGAFREVRASIARQQQELDRHMAGLDRQLEELDRRKNEIKQERKDAEKAKERLAELEGTVTA